MKRGLSLLLSVLIIAIVIVLSIIIFKLYGYYEEAREIDKEIANISQKDFNYYLPADFAALKIKRGYSDANISGVMITFRDVRNKDFVYKSDDYPNPGEDKRYFILKDDLSPKPSENWNFTDISYIDLRYLLSNGRFTIIINSISINSERISPDFDEKCSYVLEEGEQKISCE